MPHRDRSRWYKETDLQVKHRSGGSFEGREDMPMTEPIRDLMVCKARGILAWVMIGCPQGATEHHAVACLDRSETCNEFDCKFVTGKGEARLVEVHRGVAAGI